MSGKAKKPLGNDVHRVSFTDGRPVRLLARSTGHRGGRRELLQWLTTNHITALSFFILSFALSACVLANLFLEAIGVFQSPRNDALLFIGLGYSVTSGLKWAHLPRRVRPRR